MSTNVAIFTQKRGILFDFIIKESSEHLKYTIEMNRMKLLAALAAVTISALPLSAANLSE